MSFNLTDGLERSFRFSGEIEGKVNARLKEINDKLEKNGISEEEKKALEPEIEKATKEMMDAYTSMFKPIGDAMPIEEFIDSLPSNAKKRFDDMVSKELLSAE